MAPSSNEQPDIGTHELTAFPLRLELGGKFLSDPTSAVFAL